MRYSSGNSVPWKVAYLRLTTDCNAKCQMCGFWRSQPTKMQIETISKGFQKLAQLGYSEVIFTGGEPLIAQNFNVAFINAQHNSLKISVITNGILLPIYLSSQTNYDSIHCYYISVDSPIAETHNFIRGVSCLENIEIALSSRRSEPEIVINTVLSKLNRKDILLLPSWMMRNSVAMINMIFMKQPSLALEHDEAHELAGKLLRRCYEYGIKHHVTALPGGVTCDVAWKCLESPFISKCSVDSVCLFVEHDGTAFPCNCTPYFVQKACLYNLLLNDTQQHAITKTNPSQVNSIEGTKFDFCSNVCDLSNRLYNYIKSTQTIWYST